MEGNLESKEQEEVKQERYEIEIVEKYMNQFLKEKKGVISNTKGLKFEIVEKYVNQFLEEKKCEITRKELRLKEKKNGDGKDATGMDVPTEKEMETPGADRRKLWKSGALNSRKFELEAVQMDIRQLQTECKMAEEESNTKMDEMQKELKEKEMEIVNLSNEIETGGMSMEDSEEDLKEKMKKKLELTEKGIELGNMKNEMENMKLIIENTKLQKQQAITLLQEKEKDLERIVSKLNELNEKSEKEKSRLGMDKNKFNFAVTGAQGAGKSSLINGLLGLDRKSEGAAKTDVVNCTSATSQYSHPSLKDVILWDLPGMGTPDHPEETYYEDTALEAFDAVIIVTGDRILDVELKIAKLSQEAKKPVVFVRSKADKSIRDSSMDQEISMAEAAKGFREKVEENFKKELIKAELNGISILIVSSRAFLPGKSPYKLGDDTSLSLEGMDEKLVTEFLILSQTGLIQT